MKKQLELIQNLCHEVVAISRTDENIIRRKRWANLNELKSDGQPLVWICPDDDGGWAELVPVCQVFCTHPLLIPLELQLRKYIYQANSFDDDFVVEPLVRFNIPGTYTGYLYGSPDQSNAWGIEIEPMAVSGNAYHMKDYLSNPTNVEKLLEHEVDFRPDYAHWSELSSFYAEATNNILEVEFTLPYSVLVQSLLIDLVHLRGLTTLMLDLYDNPQWLHQIIDHMAQSKARLLDKLETEKLLFDNRSNIYTGSGALGYTNEPKRKSDEVKLSDLWGFADAQEFSQVSPDMFLEFAVEHQKLGLSKFGKACYGCCEAMDGKYNKIFKALPNLRRVSISPWSDIEEAADRLGSSYIFSWKPNPANFSTTFNEATIKQDLLKLKSFTYGKSHLEIILKDIRTVNNTPENLQRFASLIKNIWS